MKNCFFSGRRALLLGGVLAVIGATSLQALYVPPVNTFITGSGETVTTLSISSNSVSDAQTQIDAARTANASALIVANLSGTYEVSTAALSLPSKTCLVLQSGAVIKAATGITATALVQVTSQSDVSISGGAIIGNGANVTGIKVTTSSRVSIDHLSVQDCAANGIALTGNGNSTFDNELTVSRCDVFGGTNGISVSSATQAVLIDNTCHNNSAAGILVASARSTVANNLCSANGTGISVTGNDNNITDNEIDANATGIALTSASSNNLCTSNNFVSNTTVAMNSAGTSNTWFDNTLSGNTANLTSAGTTNNIIPRKTAVTASSQNYFYPPLIDDQHTNTTIVNGKGRTDLTIGATTIASVQSQYDAARTAHPNDVIVLHLTGTSYTGSSTLTLSSYTCVLLGGTIQMTSTLNFGISASSQSYISVSGGTIDGGGVGTTHEAVDFSGCTMVQVDGMILQNFGPSTPRTSGNNILKIWGGATPHMVTRCILNSASARGIWTNSGAKNIVSRNEVSNCNMDGIDFDAHTQGSIAKYNNCHDNVRFGIFIEQGDTHDLLLGNLCNGNGSGGFSVWNNGVNADISATQYNTSVGNICSGNNVTGIHTGSQPGSAFVEDTSHNFFFNNVVCNTTSVGLSDVDIQGTQNYYSQNNIYGNGTDYSFGAPGEDVFFNPATNPGERYLEAENLSPVGTGATVGTTADGKASDGAWAALNATGTGQYVSLTTPKLAAGTYQVEYRYKQYTARGQHSVTVDGTAVGGTVDQYGPTAYPFLSLGTVTFGSDATHLIRLTVTGKNALASAYSISADALTFVPHDPVAYEAENMMPLSGTAPLSVVADASASGGAWEAFSATATGQVVSYVTPSIPAGTYQLQFRYKQYTSRGQHTVTLDGTAIGGTIDQYGTSSYPTVTLGTVTFATTGIHTITLTVTGKNASATAYTLSADSFIFAPN